MGYLRQEKTTNYWYTLTNIVTFLTILFLSISVIGYRFEIFSVVFSLLTLTKYAIYFSLLALVLALITMGNIFSKSSNLVSILVILLNIIINIVVIFYFFNSIISLKSNPLINDISTNYDDFINYKIHRNHNIYSDEHILLQKYGGFKKPNHTLVSLQISNKSLLEVFEKSKKVLLNMGLEITYYNLSEGIIEGVDTSFWYGFKDDIIIRIEKLISDEINIDVRSASRAGKSDFGVNSMRIRNFYDKLKLNLED
tara:strand:+ start:1000 stop:1761 length:762 start_codon:yes stop_codon:yes gene_type:complete